MTIRKTATAAMVLLCVAVSAWFLFLVLYSNVWVNASSNGLNPGGLAIHAPDPGGQLHCRLLPHQPLICVHAHTHPLIRVPHRGDR